jgi:hypothetical protein
LRNKKPILLLPLHRLSILKGGVLIPSRGRDIDCRGMLSKLSLKNNPPSASCVVASAMLLNKVVYVVDSNNPSRSRELIRAEIVKVVVKNKK